MYCIQEFERQRAIIVMKHATLQWPTQHISRANYHTQVDLRALLDSSPTVICILYAQIQRQDDARIASVRRVEVLHTNPI